MTSTGGSWPTYLVHRLEYAGFRLVVGLLRLFPMETAANMFAWLCRYFAARGRRHRRALANLERALPEKSAAEREAIALSMWENLGRVIAEAAHIDRFLAEPHRFDPIDVRILDDYLPKRGVYVAVGLHTGNWEIGLLYSALRGYDPAAFYRTVKNPLVDRYIKETREKIYTGGLFAVRGEMEGRVPAALRSRQIVACLRKGVPIGILSDHRDPEGIDVPFFGRSVRVSKGAATLALQIKAPLCVARAIRLGKRSRFLGEAVEIPLPDSGDREEDIRALTTTIMSYFEMWIRQFPEQWLWSQAPFLASHEVTEHAAGVKKSGLWLA